MITDYLYKHAEEHPAKPFLVFEEDEYSFSEMADMVSAMAERLSAMGVAPGARVAMLCGNRPAFLVAWFAINEIGGVAVPLNVSLVGDGLQYILRQSECELLIVEPDLYKEKLADISAVGTGLQSVLIDSSMETPPHGTVNRWQPARPINPLDANSILYTSGTTGLPKGAVLPHQAYIHAGRDMVRSLDMTAEDRVMVFLPLFHANPQMYAVTTTLVSGATLILRPKFSAGRFFDDARQYQATGFTFVGTVLSILEKQHPGEVRNHPLKWCVGGGAPERVWREVERRYGVHVKELYGMTETGGWVTMNTADSTRIGSVGQPRQNVEICIRDAEGQPLSIGEKGEITAAASVDGVFFSEYWRNTESTASTLKEGWLYTGDRGYLDEDGYLYFDGRVKELIRRGGEMIAPTEVEQQLLKHPSVTDCAICGVADEIMGEEVKAFIVASHPVSAEALRDFLSERIARYMVPRYFAFVDAIPKTETQKIKRHELAGLTAETVDTRQVA